MTLVKICGIREYEHAEVAAEAGADLIGFVFVPVRREIMPDVARSIIDRVREKYARPPVAVGLFVNETAERINEVVREAGLDLVQLHGDEPPELAHEIEVPMIKALRLGSSMDAAAFESTVRAYLATCAAVHIDSDVPGKWGGTGVVGDWEISGQIALRYPTILAGGLTPENVRLAISQVRPAIADVSTGVETEGRKDPDRIRDFITNAREAFDELETTAVGAELVTLITELRDRHRVSGQRVSAQSHSRLS